MANDTSLVSVEELVLLGSRVGWAEVALGWLLTQELPRARLCASTDIPELQLSFFVEHGVLLPRISPSALHYESVRRAHMVGFEGSAELGVLARLGTLAVEWRSVLALTETAVEIACARWGGLGSVPAHVALLLRLAWRDEHGDREVPADWAELPGPALDDALLQRWMPSAVRASADVTLRRALHEARRAHVHGLDVLLITLASSDYGEAMLEALRERLFRGSELGLVALFHEGDWGRVVGWSRTHRLDCTELLRPWGVTGSPEQAVARVSGLSAGRLLGELRRLLPLTVRREATVGTIMSSPARCVDIAAPLTSTLEELNRHHLDAIVVTFEGGYAGVALRRDVDAAIRHGLGERHTYLVTRIEPQRLNPMNRLSKALPRILDTRQKLWPVCEGKKVVGAVTDWNVRETIREGLCDLATRHQSTHPTLLRARTRSKRRVHDFMEQRLPSAMNGYLRTISGLLESEGLRGYLVGGVVRDMLLERVSLDIDVVVEGDGIAFAKRLARSFRGRHVGNAAFGTAKVHHPDGVTIDIASARGEYYEQPGALPTVGEGSFHDDMRRRDFTMNALALSLNARMYGQLEDVFGGEADLQAGLLRVLHPLSFLEDPTRILRGVRFAARFGYRFANDTQRWLEEAVELDAFRGISGERLMSELRLILASPEHVSGLELLEALGLFEAMGLPLRFRESQRRLARRLPGLTAWYVIGGYAPKLRPWLVRFAALVWDRSEDDVEALAARLQLTKDLRQRLLATARLAADAQAREVLADPAARPSRWLRRIEGVPVEALIVLAGAAECPLLTERVMGTLKGLGEVKPHLTGKDLVRLGLTPGPGIRDALEELRTLRLDGYELDADEERLVAGRHRAGE